ncbi:MAG: hypothetical protein KAS70_00885 [Planctomycetes bacterium]|nr:hypothetical protein [Planctomycetota bacterium]MCK5579099.1 hypothetical protein [Planctomycetota bacterium]
MSMYISENGFITLTLAAIETSTKYEASGILLGYDVFHKRKHTYFVESVIPYQIAEREADSIYVMPYRKKRIRRVFHHYMKYKIIGEFHTHPGGSINLSSADKDDIRSSDYQLEIVVALEKKKKICPWKLKRGVLSGSIEEYFIEIASWRVKGRKIMKQSIRCPFAVGFDYSKPLSI